MISAVAFAHFPSALAAQLRTNPYDLEPRNGFRGVRWHPANGGRPPPATQVGLKHPAASHAATGTAPPLQTLTINAYNQISNPTAFTYDNAGNQTADAASAYQWYAAGNLEKAFGVTYSYDGDGNRVMKSNGKIYWRDPNGQVLDESDLSGNFTDEYVYFGGMRIAHRVVSSNSIYYYAPDALGSSRVIAGSAGTACYDSDFYPFGGEQNHLNTSGSNYKFTGQERDATLLV